MYYSNKNNLYRYILYVAESPKQSLVEYLYLGTFGEMPKASRPIVIIYDIENLTFKPIETIPEHYTAGEISWKADSSGIIGKYKVTGNEKSCDFMKFLLELTVCRSNFCRL